MLDKGKHKRYKYNGKEYTIKELAEMAGLSYTGMYDRLQRLPLEQAINGRKEKRKGRPRKKYEYKGQAYSIKQLSEIAGISYSMMRKRLSIMPVDKAMESQKIEYKDKNYSLTALSRLAGTTNSKMACRLKTMSVEDAVETLRKENIIMYEYNGKKYTIRELAEMAGVKYHAMYQRLLKMPVEDAMKIQSGATRPIMYKGEKQSIKQLTEVAGVNYSTLCNRLSRGMDLETAVENKRLVNEYEYKGKMHTIPEWSKLSGLAESTIRCRLKEIPDMQFVFFPKRKSLADYGLSIDDVRNNIGVLDEREAMIIDFTYGITVEMGKNFSEIGEEMEISREYIRILHNIAIEKIADSVKMRSAKCQTRKA